jgi:PAS domain S-box-containing protein
MVPALPRLFERLVQDAPDAIVYADAEGVIRFWNRGAERIFGFTATEAVGQSLDIIIPENQRARHWEGYRAVMKSGASRYGAGDLLAVPGLRKDGARISLEFTIVPVHGEDDLLCGIAAFLRDVTKRFAEMKELRRQLAATARP